VKLISLETGAKPAAHLFPAFGPEPQREPIVPFPSRLKKSILIGVVVLGTVLVLFCENFLFGVGDFRSVVVVSDPFHMRRARWAFRKVLNDRIELQMAPVPFELTPYQRTWRTDPESRSYVREEYEKFIYYIARYQLRLGEVPRVAGEIGSGLI
jgi:hypothetical protein